jgi:hypothetical protein
MASADEGKPLRKWQIKKRMKEGFQNDKNVRVSHHYG